MHLDAFIKESDTVYLREKNFNGFCNFNLIYYTLFVAYSALTCLTFTSFSTLSWFHIDQLYFGVRVACIVILGMRIISQRYAKSTLLIMIGAGCILVISTLTSGSWGILLAALFIIAGKNASLQKIAKCILWSSLGITILAIVAANIGLIPSFNLGARRAYGFTHPNSLGSSILTACCAYGVINFRKFRWFDFLLYGYAFYFCYEVACSRTSSYAIALIAVASFLVSVIPQKIIDKPFLCVGTVLLIGLSVFSIWLMINYNPLIGWMYNFDRLLSNRIELMHHYYVTYHLHPFGFDFSTIQEAYKIHVSQNMTGVYTTFIVDNAYAHVFLESGYFVWILIIVLYISFLVKQIKVGILSASSFGLILFAVVGFTENAGLSISNNFCLVAFVSFVFKHVFLEDEGACPVCRMHDCEQYRPKW